jgi:hypothetical protein
MTEQPPIRVAPKGFTRFNAERVCKAGKAIEIRRILTEPFGQYPIVERSVNGTKRQTVVPRPRSIQTAIDPGRSDPALDAPFGRPATFSARFDSDGCPQGGTSSVVGLSGTATAPTAQRHAGRSPGIHNPTFQIAWLGLRLWIPALRPGRPSRRYRVNLIRSRS